MLSPAKVTDDTTTKSARYSCNKKQHEPPPGSYSHPEHERKVELRR